MVSFGAQNGALAVENRDKLKKITHGLFNISFFVLRTNVSETGQSCYDSQLKNCYCKYNGNFHTFIFRRYTATTIDRVIVPAFYQAGFFGVDISIA